MKIYDYNHIKKLYVIGDVHGEFKELFNYIKVNGLSYNKESFKEELHPLEVQEQEERQEEECNIFNPFGSRHRMKSTAYNDSVIIVCGDCGFGFNKAQYYFDLLGKANELFSTTNTHLLFVRGNHDDPSYFDGETINLSNIKAIPDYSIVITSKYNTLCVGGAISVDRIWRKQQEVRLNKYSSSKSKRLYWDDEAPILNENLIEELKDNNITINSVVTHTSPSFVYPIQKESSLGWLKIDKNLNEDIKKERDIMDKLYNLLLTNNIKINFWAYGHFHNNFEEYKDGTAFVALCESPHSLTNIDSSYQRMKDNWEYNNQKKNRKVKKPNNPSDVMSISISELMADTNFIRRDNVDNPRHMEHMDDMLEEIEELVYNNNGNEADEAPF